MSGFRPLVAGILLGVSAGACSRPRPSPTLATPAATHATVVHGAIEGEIAIASASVVVGEPIVAVVTARSRNGVLPVYVGGDQRNAAAFPTRLTFKVFDAKNQLVCDTLAKPALMSFGGLGGVRTFPAGTVFRETAVLNAMCPALATPGDYRLVLHRRLAHDAMNIHRPGNDTPLSCDIYPVHEGPLPEGYEAGCAPIMAGLPSLTRSIPLHVAPFDAVRFRQGTEARWREADGTPNSEGRARIGAWLNGWVTCPRTEPTPPERASLGALPDRLPPSFPAACPRE